MFPAAPFPCLKRLRLAGPAARSRAAPLGLLRPDPGMHGRGLVLQQRADHFGRPLAAGEDFAARQIERWIFRVVAGELPQADVRSGRRPGGRYRPSRSRPHTSRRVQRTNRAWRCAGYSRRSWCRPASPAAVRHARCRHGRHIAVLGFEQHLPVLGDQDSAERMIAVRRRTAGHLKGSPQEMRVELRRAEC